MDDKIFEHRRKSFIELDKIFFWTATINKWQRLLEEDNFKEIIINSLRYLTSLNKIDVFAFVIMPNHVHFLWKMKAMNGKEMPHVSFLKHTAHLFKKQLKSSDKLKSYAVDAPNKSYEFWQRDSLAIDIYAKDITYIKLDYIHYNPLQDHWKLASTPKDYFYSSASFYEGEANAFNFLKDICYEF